jgi:peroxiredoxin
LQVVDLLKDPAFQRLDVELVSIAPDPPDAWRADGTEFGLTDFSTVLTDAGNEVAARYDVLKWKHPVTGEPGHTFILVGEDGRVEWIRDYGAPEHGGVMYVVPHELVGALRNVL